MKTSIGIIFIMGIVLVANLFILALLKKGKWKNIFSDKKRDLKLINPKEKAL